MTTHSPEPFSESEIYLVPSGSYDAQQNLDTAVRGKGISLSTIDEELGDPAEIRDQIKRLEDRKAELDDEILQVTTSVNECESTIQDLEQRLDELKAALDSETVDQTVTEPTNQNTTSPDDREQPFDDRDEFESTQDELETIREKRQRQRDKLDSLEEERERVSAELGKSQTRLERRKRGNAELEALERYADDGHVQFWGVQQNTIDTWTFDSGDVFLFYTGDYQYTVAGIVQAQLEAPVVADTVWESSDDTTYPHLVIFETTHEIDLDSGVIAEYGGHDIDYVFGFTRLNDAGQRQLIEDFNNIGEFLNEAQQGLSERPVDTGDQALVERFDSGDRLDVTANPNAPFGEYTVLAGQLRHHKQLLLMGPEETGKRAGARAFAEAWLEEERRILDDDAQSSIPIDDRIHRTTFYENLDYEGFILGDKQDQATIPQGSFGQFCELAVADQSPTATHRPRYVLIIEDLLQADLPTVFGPAWANLPAAQRGSERAVTLSQTGFDFWIPDNVYLIGITHTSLNDTRELAPDVRARFGSHTIQPAYDRLEEIYDVPTDAAPSSYDFPQHSVVALKALNERISASDALGGNAQLGHMYFSATLDSISAYDKSRLVDVWQYDLLPAIGARIDAGATSLLKGLPVQGRAELDSIISSPPETATERITDLVEEFSKSYLN